jgi:hypothetical protein
MTHWTETAIAKAVAVTARDLRPDIFSAIQTTRTA